MNILIGTLGSGGVHWQNLGIANAFASCGYQVRLWKYNTESILDIFETFKPDVFISSGYASFLTSAVQKAIKRYRPKTLLYVPAHPKSFAARVKKAVNDLVFDVATAEDVIAINDIGKYIDGVYIHHHPDVSNIYLEGWENHCKRYYGIGMACDIVAYDRGQEDASLKCDVSIIGGAWGWKLKKMAPWIYPLCNDPNLNVKIFGQGWGVIQALGPISENLASSVWRNTKVNLGINEPQAGYVYDGVELPEVNERPLKVIGCGNFIVSDYVGALANNYFRKDEIITAKTALEYQILVRDFVRDASSRELYSKRGQKRVLFEHTYHDRILDIHKILGLGNGEDRILEIKNKIIQEKFNI